MRIVKLAILIVGACVVGRARAQSISFYPPVAGGSSSAITALTGQVSATGPGAAAGTVTAIDGGVVAAAQACHNTAASPWACSTGAGDFAEQAPYAILFVSDFASAASQQLNVDGDGPSQIFEHDGTPVATNDILPGVPYLLVYYGGGLNGWVMQGPNANLVAGAYSVYGSNSGAGGAPVFFPYGQLITFDMNANTGLAAPTADTTFTYPGTSVTGLTIAGAGGSPASSGNGTAASTLFRVVGAPGGTASGTTGVTGGTGSSPSMTGGAGGIVDGATGANVGGVGGSVTLTGGRGGAAGNSGATSGVGGSIILAPGAAGSISGGAAIGTPGSIVLNGRVTTNTCASGASPAVCGASIAGSVAIPTNVTSSTLTVNTTNVTASSQILLTIDDSATVTSTTCNTTAATLAIPAYVSARTAGTSFTISYLGTIATHPVCVNFLVIN